MVGQENHERRMMLKILLACALVSSSIGYKMFQDRIPNGASVPNSCNKNYLWQGVGHFNNGGGGERNPFGIDFYKNGKKWDRCLCETDSDGDGKTNGEELGDPLCKWEPGDVPHTTIGLSHPGICEPLEDPMCVEKNQKFGDICELVTGSNPCLEDIKKQDGVKTWDLKLSRTKVPAKTTTYICQEFKVPDVTKDYHVIADEPLIDNSYVMHHIVLNACSAPLNTTGANECGMASDGCLDTIGLWTVGTYGSCTNENFGFRIGKTGFKYLVMQLHWNNPEAVDHYYDTSGIRLYYTETLRPNDGGILTTGQMYLELPGGRRDVKIEGNCPSSCTEQYPSNIYFTDSLIHMHYLGYKGYIQHLRDGEVINDLITEDSYSYDSPRSFPHRPAIEFRPGDELKTTCHFKTTSKDTTTYYGDATDDEMCFGFITYYPAMPSFNGCNEWGETPMCTAPGEGVNMQTFGDCDFAFFETMAEYLTPLYSVCDASGQTCYPDCKTKWEELKNGEPCLRGDPYTFMMWAVEKYFGEYADTLIKLMSVCEPKPNYTTDDMSDTWDDDDADDDVSDEWWGGEELLCDATYPKASGAPALCNAVMLSLSLVLVSVSLFF